MRATPRRMHVVSNFPSTQGKVCLGTNIAAGRASNRMERQEYRKHGNDTMLNTKSNCDQDDIRTEEFAGYRAALLQNAIPKLS
jgi:succinate dehydrogenase/fumarate reductase flavoprotein subunit